MTNLEAIELIWKRATPKVPGPDPEFEKAHSMVGKLLKHHPGFVELKAVGVFDELQVTTQARGSEKRTSGE